MDLEGLKDDWEVSGVWESWGRYPIWVLERTFVFDGMVKLQVRD